MGTTEESLSKAKAWGIGAGNTFKFADNARGVSDTLTMTSNARNAYHSLVQTASASGQSVNSLKATKYKTTTGADATATADSLLSSQENLKK